MANELKPLYFRKLRMLYCSELQLISFLPELEQQTPLGGLPTRDLLNLCRQRRNTLETIAADQNFSIAGDDCQAMRRLISEGRRCLRNCNRGQSREAIAADISNGAHRLLVVNYSMARNLAVRLQLRREADCIEELVDHIVELTPGEITSIEAHSPRLVAAIF